MSSWYIPYIYYYIYHVLYTVHCAYDVDYCTFYICIYMYVYDSCTVCVTLQICKYTGDNIEDFGNAVCDPCNGCMCRPGTVQESDGTCIPVSHMHMY